MATLHRTWILPPPADRITPAVARRWLSRSYAPLARLTSMAVFPDVAMRGIGLRMLERDHALSGLRIIAGDVRRITEACGKALASGRAVPMELDPDLLIGPRSFARDLRAVLKYERRRPQRGARAILRRALAVQEQLAKAQPRSQATRWQAWRRVLHDMGNVVLKDYLTNEEQAMYMRKVSARLPDGDTTVEKALTEKDLMEILIDVLEETRGDEDLD